MNELTLQAWLPWGASIVSNGSAGPGPDTPRPPLYAPQNYYLNTVCHERAMLVTFIFVVIISIILRPDTSVLIELTPDRIVCDFFRGILFGDAKEIVRSCRCM